MKRYTATKAATLLAITLMGLSAPAALAQDSMRQDTTRQDTASQVPSDAEILQIFVTSNQGEVITSEPVDSSASEPVRAYARRMMEEHGRVLDRIDSLAAEAGMTPQPNLVSASMTNAAEGTLKKLRSLSGQERDRAYVLAQIVLHQQTLDMLDYTLIPNAQDEALRTLLEETRPAIAEHLEQAKGIYQEMPAM